MLPKVVEKMKTHFTFKQFFLEDRAVEMLVNYL
jgi:hypothetical protein